jgi:putative ABC transport system substrate-binding protein
MQITINEGNAQALGITIPQELLNGADLVK